MRACLRTARARSECNAPAIEKVVMLHIWVFEIHSPVFYMMLHVHKNTPQIQTLDPDLI